MRTIQFTDFKGTRRVGIVHDAHTIAMLAGEQTLYALAQAAVTAGCGLTELLSAKAIEKYVDYTTLIEAHRLLPPVDHPDPAHMLISGTGLTHLGSANARNKMHQDTKTAMTDSMKMFHMGIEGGKPPAGQTGVQPEWFYKGNGHWLVTPYQVLESPAFALGDGEEPEIVGLYIIGPEGTPYRLGFALGNEFSDHVIEKQNYLYLAHSKLRPCAFGPELLLGDLPKDIQGHARIWRSEEVIWEKPFYSGEDHMSHSLANLEYHHFKYSRFRHPGDVHAHFFGTATLSFADQVSLQPDDVIEIEAPDFGRPLRNTVGRENQQNLQIVSLE